MIPITVEQDYEMRRSQLENDVRKLRQEYSSTEESVAVYQSEIRNTSNPYSRQRLGEMLTKKTAYFESIKHSLSDAVDKLDRLTVEALVPDPTLKRSEMSDTQKIEVIKQHGSAYYNRIPL